MSDSLPFDLSHLDLPEVLEIRGEIYMSHGEFTRLNEKRIEEGLPLYANPRNLAAGTVKLLDPKEAASASLRSSFTEWVPVRPNLDFPISPSFMRPSVIGTCLRSNFSNPFRLPNLRGRLLSNSIKSGMDTGIRRMEPWLSSIHSRCKRLREYRQGPPLGHSL